MDLNLIAIMSSKFICSCSIIAILILAGSDFSVKSQSYESSTPEFLERKNFFQQGKKFGPVILKYMKEKGLPVNLPTMPQNNVETDENSARKLEEERKNQNRKEQLEPENSQNFTSARLNPNPDSNFHKDLEHLRLFIEKYPEAVKALLRPKNLDLPPSKIRPDDEKYETAKEQSEGNTGQNNFTSSKISVSLNNSTSVHDPIIAIYLGQDPLLDNDSRKAAIEKRSPALQESLEMPLSPETATPSRLLEIRSPNEPEKDEGNAAEFIEEKIFRQQPDPSNRYAKPILAFQIIKPTDQLVRLGQFSKDPYFTCLPLEFDMENDPSNVFDAEQGCEL